MIKNTFISNVLEGFYRSYQSLNKKSKNYWITYDTLEANRALLYGMDNKVIFTSSPINNDHLQQIKNLFNLKEVINFYPKHPSPFICQDIYKKKELQKQIINLIKNNPQINLIPYRATPEFYQLVKFLRDKKLVFNTPETIPYDQQFINSYFHSKKGFRHLWGEAVILSLKTISLPQGFITDNRKQAIEASWWFFKQKRSFVIKYNYGTQGVGLIINDYLNFSKEKKHFEHKLNQLLKDKIWNEGVIIVEELINVNKNIFAGSPSIEFFIDHTGKVIPTYACEQVLAKDRKTFRGVYIHREVIEHPLIKNAFQAGLLFGKALSDLGYRGYFDIDLVISNKNQVYAVESNMRRTGGTHIHETALALLGQNYWQKYFVLSEDSILEKKVKLDYKQVLFILKDLIFNKKNNEGIIFTNPDMLKFNIVNLLLIAKSHQKITFFREKISNLLNQLH